MDGADDWRRLCELLDDDEAVWETVGAALGRGDDPWEALLDGLDDAGALAYLQATDTGMELSDALAQLPRVVRLQLDLGAVTDTDDLPDATRLADSLLTSFGLRIVRLVEDEESWPIVVIPAESGVELVRLAEGLGGGRIVASH